MELIVLLLSAGKVRAFDYSFDTARSAAMNGSYCAVSNNAGAVFYNPAGLADLYLFNIQGLTNVIGLTDKWVTDKIQTGINVQVPLRLNSTFGIAYVRNSAGVVADYEQLVINNYSLSISPNLFAGINVKYGQYNPVAGYNARVTGFDIGVITKSMMPAIKSKLNLGLSIQNILGKMEWNTGSKESVPVNTKAGCALFVGKDLMLGYEMDLVDHVVFHQFGAEYSIGTLFSWRLGYKFDPEERNDAFSTGVGVRIGNVGIDLGWKYRLTVEAGHANSYFLNLNFIPGQLGIYQIGNPFFSTKQISPNNDGVNDKFSIFTDGAKVSAWKLVVKSKKGEIVRVLEGEEKLVTEIQWDGKNEDNVYVAEGDYQYNFNIIGLQDDVYNDKGTVFVDYTKPFIQVSVFPAILELNARSKNKLAISIDIADNVKVDTWEVSILDSGRSVVKWYDGKEDAKKVIEWDGKDQHYNRFVDNGKYRVQVKAIDSAGNGIVRETQFEVKGEGVIVSQVAVVREEKKEPVKEVTEQRSVRENVKPAVSVPPAVFKSDTNEGLKHKVLFPAGSIEIVPSSNRVMERVVRTLTTYPRQKVVVIGYCDPNESNVDDLARQRADVVQQMLAQRGIKAERIKVESRGAKNVDGDSRTADGQARNRRVEIVFVE